MIHVDKVGVELEGAWNAHFPDDDPTEIYADHSVRNLEGFKHIGEVASPPLSLEEALSWVRTHYPEGTSNTCGMHIHVSTKREEDYVKLAATPHFFMKFLLWGSEFISGMAAGADKELFLTRISGGNRFCSLKFIPDKQLRMTRKGFGNTVRENPRYTMLNFAKGVHGTMENRTFPMFHVKGTALDAIESYVEMVEDFLLLKAEEGEDVEVMRFSR